MIFDESKLTFNVELLADGTGSFVSIQYSPESEGNYYCAFALNKDLVDSHLRASIEELAIVANETLASDYMQRVDDVITNQMIKELMGRKADKE